VRKEYSILIKLKSIGKSEIIIASIASAISGDTGFDIFYVKTLSPPFSSI